jgi:hypothetical protein
MRVELFHAEGRTDTTKLMVAFRNFANAHNDSVILKQFFRSDFRFNFSRDTRIWAII